MNTSVKEVADLLDRHFINDKHRNCMAYSPHEECVYMRTRLVALANECLIFCLGEVMKDLMYNLPDESEGSQDAEAVVQFFGRIRP